MTAPIIVIMPDFPTANTGGGQRSLLFLDAVAALGPVHLVILSDQIPQDAARTLPVVSVEGWGRLQPGVVILRRMPHALQRLLLPGQSYRTDPALRARLDGLIARTGARTVLFRYFRAFAAAGCRKRDDLAVLVDIDDRDDQRYADRLARMFGKRLGNAGLPRILLDRLARTMTRRLADASLVWFCAAEDVWTIPGTRTTILPNVPLFAPARDTPPPSQGDAVLFVGIYSHVPNRDGICWFLDHCWADLSRQVPDIHLRIVGRGTLWHEMAARYTHLERVEFVGPVADLAAEYDRARLCICPVREGGGSKIKVIEAAAFGRPIVGVPHAFRGFDAGLLDHAAEALSPQDFTRACVAFLTDADLADRAGAALAGWQQRNYSPDAARRQLRNDILSVTGPAG